MTKHGVVYDLNVMTTRPRIHYVGVPNDSILPAIGCKQVSFVCLPTVNSHECSEIACCLSDRLAKYSSFHINESINCSKCMTSLQY